MAGCMASVAITQWSAGSLSSGHGFALTMSMCPSSPPLKNSTRLDDWGTCSFTDNQTPPPGSASVSSTAGVRGPSWTG
eukprot:304145-Rhodomonas_salina.1